ncbi:Na+/H+ antiporter 1 [Actinosynnema pretiosum]|nr:Na+/H+ antiporter 1 [Actinosynnema pretiosum]
MFALTSVGVDLSGVDGFRDSAVVWGVPAGRLVGKPLGIVGATWLPTWFTRARLDPVLGRPDVLGAGLPGSIGFTVSVLVVDLPNPGGASLAGVDAAVLLASATAALPAGVYCPRVGGVRPGGRW